MFELFEAVIFSTLDAAPALIFAACGAVLCERSGVVNVAAEGMMRVGAFVAAVSALVMPTGLAVLCGAGAAAVFALLHALLCVRLRADQVVSGMALNLVALALGTFLLEALFTPVGTPSITQLTRTPVLLDLPLLRALFGHPALTYLAPAVALSLQWVMTRTAFGLRLRAVGEKPQAAATLGISVNGLRTFCVVASGALCGLGGAALSCSTLDRFEQHMPSGLGFMALAAMVFGRWTFAGAMGAALFFSAANVLRIGLSSSAPALAQAVPQGFLLALPYLLTLVVLAAGGKKSRAPAALGAPYHPESR